MQSAHASPLKPTYMLKKYVDSEGAVVEARKFPDEECPTILNTCLGEICLEAGDNKWQVFTGTGLMAFLTEEAFLASFAELPEEGGA